MREPAVNYAAITIRPDRTVASRPAVHLALVIDGSASMAAPISFDLERVGAGFLEIARSLMEAMVTGPRKIDLAKAASRRVLDAMQDGDVLCLICFSDRAAVVLPAQALGPERAALHEAIAQMGAHGGTHMARGIEAAEAQLARMGGEGAVRKLVILTDGQTRGEHRCLELAERSSIPYLLGGIGHGYNHRLLEEMACRTRGRAEYIDRPEAVQDFFIGAVSQARSTVLTHAVLQMEFRGSFRPRRIHQVLPKIVSYDFTPITATNHHTGVALGDIGQEGMTLLIEYLHEVGAAAASEFQVAGLTFQYDQPPRSRLGVQSEDWTIQLADHGGFPPLDPGVAVLIDRAGVETAQRNVLAAADAGDAARMRTHLQALQHRLERIGAEPSFIQQTVETMHLQLDTAATPAALAESDAARRLTSGTRRLSLPRS